jgi:hypothetical protein
MLSRTFTCNGFDGSKFDVTFDFHLRESEVTKINMGTFVGLDVLMKRLFDTKNGEEIVKIMDKIIMTSVGRESLDHHSFIKNDEIRNEFTQTDAYDQLFMELTTDMDKLSAFIRDILPAKMRDKILEANAERAAAEQASAPLLAEA